MRWAWFASVGGLIGLLVVFATPPTGRAAPAADDPAACAWPEFHGPRRDNLSPASGLRKVWPEAGPPLLWTADGLGHGYSTVAVADGRIFTTGNVDQQTVITALAMDGSVAWRVANGPAWLKPQPGARSTPTLDAGRLYHMNSHGDLVCLDAGTGRRLWHANVLQQFNGRNIEWGLAESVLVDGDRVIATTGGDDIGMVALDKTTGKPVWTCRGAGDKPGYCSPVLFEYAGLRQIVTLMAKSVVGVHADTGRLLWQVPHETPFDENIGTPLYHDGGVFVSTRTTGSRLLRLKVSGQDCSVAEVWSTTALENQHGGVLLVDGRLYGTSLDASNGPWACIEWATGKRVWSDKGIGRASATWADGRLYALSHTGTVALIEPSPVGFRAVSTFEMPKGGKGPHWAHPVVCGGRLYLRHGETVFCYDVSARP